MKILFTGASSFTGYWFIKELVKKGHEVTAVFRQRVEDYTGIRKQRVEELLALCSVECACEFGSDAFIQLICRQEKWDLLCHHAAEVNNYKSLDFDFQAALHHNTKNVLTVLHTLKNRGCGHILLTGTVFEQDEGAGSNLNAVYPYALSKGLTYQVFRYYAEKLKMTLGKFIIPNPFGPYEEFRFTSYLIQSWLTWKIPTVTTPAYIRDNIHVDLLAKAYTSYSESLVAQTAPEGAFRPSGYVETQGSFAKRFSEMMSCRLSIPCPFESQEQKEFPEPHMRINTDPLKGEEYGWNEHEAWDNLASYYLTSTKKC